MTDAELAATIRRILLNDQTRRRQIVDWIKEYLPPLEQIINRVNLTDQQLMTEIRDVLRNDASR